MSDSNRNRREQRAARDLAAREDITYMQALERVRGDAPAPKEYALTGLFSAPATSDVEERFRAFIEDNKQVIPAMAGIAHGRLAEGHESVSVEELLFAVRHPVGASEATLAGPAGNPAVEGISNEFKPFLARLLLVFHPDLIGRFVLRRLQAEPTWAGKVLEYDARGRRSLTGTTADGRHVTVFYREDGADTDHLDEVDSSVFGGYDLEVTVDAATIDVDGVEHYINTIADVEALVVREPGDPLIALIPSGTAEQHELVAADVAAFDAGATVAPSAAAPDSLA